MSQTFWLDESYRSRYITLGGFFCHSANTGQVANIWRGLKQSFGLEPESELKYTISEDHPSRAGLDEGGWVQAVRVPAMLAAIADMPLVIVVTTIEDGRLAHDRHVTDMYPDALRWVLRGFAIGVHGPEQHHHLVITDAPPGVGDLRRVAVSRRMRSLLRSRGTYAFDIYRDLYEHIQHTSTIQWPSLRELGFESCLLSSHARYSDHLQIADVIVGAVRDFVEYNLQGANSWGQLPEPSWRDENLGVLMPRFRRQGDLVWNRGFGFFPEAHAAAASLQGRLEELAAVHPNT